MANLMDLQGQRFERLTVIGPHFTRKGKTYWPCRCDCGNESQVWSDDLRHGRIKSCGCLNREKAGANLRTHGLTKRPEFIVWVNMRNRCQKPDHRDYHRYGARGITVCDRWQAFEHFLADMGPRPSRAHTLERVDNTGSYEPGNCRWATRTDQANNRRSSVLLTYNGETLTIREWERRMGVGRALIWQRINRLGWSVEKALITPVRPLRRT